MAFCYNVYSGEDIMKQYGRHVQNQNYVNQISSAIQDTGKEIADSNKVDAEIMSLQVKEAQWIIENSSREQRETILEASETVCSSLEDGFAMLNDSLGGEIKSLSRLVGHGFDQVVQGQRITHNYLGQIKDLLRIPDSQKDRFYRIEEGLKYLLNAIAEEDSTSDFYSDALEEFKEAERIEKKDFFSLFYIGYIYLKSTKHLDPALAEVYFRKAARFYLAEAKVGGTNVSKSLSQTHIDFNLGAVESYLFAAESCYLQSKYSEAVELASNAWDVLPELLKAGFYKAKYLAANKQVEDSIDVLKKMLEQNWSWVMAITYDGDLISKSEVQKFLEDLRIEALQEAQSMLKDCQKEMVKGSVAIHDVASIENLVATNLFMEVKAAIGLLTKYEKREFRGAHIDDHGQVLAKISMQEFEGNIVDFVKFEGKRLLALPTAEELIKKQKRGEQNLLETKELELQKNEVLQKIQNLESTLNRYKSDLRKRWAIWGLLLVLVLASAAFEMIWESKPRNPSTLVSLLVGLNILFFLLGLVIVPIRLFKNLKQSFSDTRNISQYKSELKIHRKKKRELDKMIKNLKR